MPGIFDGYRVSRRGGAVIEFAVILPMMVLIILGVWHFGHAYYVYANLEQAVRDGARYGSMSSYVEGSEGTFVSKIKCVVYCGSPDCTGSPVVPGLAVGNIDVTVTKPGSYYRPTSIQVRIGSFTTPLPFSNMVLVRKPQVKYVFTGYYAAFAP